MDAGFYLTLNEAFADKMGDDTSFADCWLTADEIAADPDAAMFAEAFMIGSANALGIDVATMEIVDIDTDGDGVQGCRNALPMTTTPMGPPSVSDWSNERMRVETGKEFSFLVQIMGTDGEVKRIDNAAIAATLAVSISHAGLFVDTCFVTLPASLPAARVAELFRARNES